jgi:TP901 family phage tail tape measure protein
MVKTLTYVLLGKDGLSPVASKAGKNVEGAFGRMSGSAKEFAHAAGIAGIGLGAGLAVAAGESVRMATEFQSAMEKVHTQAGASQKSVSALTQSVLQLGTHAEQSPVQLADALYHLKSVGLDDVDAMKALKTSSDLAAVGGSDLEATTNALGGAWRSGIKGAQSFGQTASTVNAIIGAGNMRMEDFVGAIGTGILPAAKTFGVSLQQVGAGLALMTDEGVPAEDAATRLRMSLSLLGAPSKAADKVLKQIGLSGLQLADSMRSPAGLVGTITLLKDHLDKSGLSASRQAQILSNAFGGGRSSSAILTMVNNLDVLRLKQDQINKTTGNYAGAVEAQRKTASAQFAILRSNIDVIGVRLGTMLLPPLAAFASFIGARVLPIVASFLGKFNGAFSGGFLTSIRQAGASLSRVFGPALAGLVHSSAAFIGMLVTSFRNLIPVIAPIARALAGIVGAGVIVAFRELGALLAGVVGPALIRTTAFIRQNQTLFKSLAIIIAIVTAAYKANAAAIALWAIVTRAAGVATKAFAAAQAVLNVIMDANPIFLVVTALAALGAAFYYAWTHSATFRKIVEGAWNGIRRAAEVVWNSGLKPVFNALVTAWQVVAGVFRAAVGWVVGTFDRIKSAVTGNFMGWWKQNSAQIMAIWRVLWTVIHTIFEIYWKIIRTEFTVGWAIIKAIWKISISVLTIYWRTWWMITTTILKAAWLVITAIAKVGWILLRAIFQTGIAYVTGVWRIAWSIISNVAKVAWAAVRTLIKIGWDLLVGTFTIFLDLLTGRWGKAWQAMRTMVQQIWNAVKAFFAVELAAFRNIFSTTLSTIVGFFRGLGGRIIGVVSGFGSLLVNTGRSLISGLFSGITGALRGVGSWVKANIFDPIVGAIKSLFGIHSPSTVMASIGGHLVGGLIKGILKANPHAFISKVFGSLPNALGALITKGIVNLTSLPASVLAKLGGVLGSVFGGLFGGGGGGGGGGGSVEAMAKAMAAARGWTGAMWNAIEFVEMHEAGWNLTATNPSSGAYGIAQGITGPSWYYQWPGGNPNTAIGQIIGFFDYIASRYGNPMAAAAHEAAFNWYASGTRNAKPGLAWTGEHGRELVLFGGGERVIPGNRIPSAGKSGGNTYILNVYPTPMARSADIGRDVVNHIREFEKGSGKGWRS